MEALLAHPEQLDRLRRDPSLIPTAVEEILRWTVPANQMLRTATCDTEVRGVAIRKGAFDIGEHFCLAAGLARMEIRVLLEELLPRLRSVRLSGTPKRIETNFIVGWKELPIEIELDAAMAPGAGVEGGLEPQALERDRD